MTAFTLLAATAVSTASATTSSARSADDVELVVFHRDGCPHCADALRWMEGLQSSYPDLRISRYEISTSATNRDLFVAMSAAHGFEPTAVPTIFLDDLYWVGFGPQVADQIERAIATRFAGLQPVQEDRTEVEVPFIGSVDVGNSSLVVSTLIIGFADGLNPCSFWVLSVLFALVLRSGSRRRVLAVGFTFLTVTSALYGLYMFGAYSALDYADRMTWVRAAIALVALTFGVLHVKEYVTHAGPSVTISDRRKPGMYRSMRALADPTRSLPAVLAGTVVLATGVSLAETPCTAGLPLLWTSMLSDAGVNGLGTAALFVLYLTVFLIDEMAVFGIAVLSMRAIKLQEHHAKGLQLLSGTLMIALALAMLFAPDLMTSLGGVAIVFGATAVVVTAVLVSERWWRTSRRAQARTAATARAKKTALRAR
ncbi:MAG TPA: hypothetical protein DCR14_12665 [Acidimicrobiaceae bacterium]|nr:hypothetical protein [Acidimicrobiaceae bacterium]